MSSHQDALRDIERQILVVAVADVPSTFLIGAGLFGKFSPAAADVLPFLGDPTLVDSMLFAGLMLLGWCGWRFFTLVRRRSALLQQAARFQQSGQRPRY